MMYYATIIDGYWWVWSMNAQGSQHYGPYTSWWEAQPVVENLNAKAGYVFIDDEQEEIDWDA